LVLRYEDLIQAGPDLASEIAGFLGHTDPVQPWINPFKDFNSKNPEMYRKGSPVWHRPDEWCDRVDEAFWAIHGGTMLELGYCREEERITDFTEDWLAQREGHDPKN